jgi:hypothetical protein
MKTLLMLYCFCIDLQICQAKRQHPKISHPTFVKWYGTINDLLIQTDNETPLVINGSIVEMDESMCGRVQKYKKGKKYKRYLVFGLLEKGTRK